MQKKFIQTLGGTLSMGLLLAGCAFAQAGTTSSADTKFAKEAASGGMAEVQLGQLAVQNASSEQVKKFGQRMVDDHTKANDQLKGIAAKDNITLPTDLNAKDKATLQRLQGLKGAAFDRAYMQDMVKDHQHDVSDFQKEASSGSNPDLKSFASQTVPTLQDHLKMAQDASRSVGAMSKK